MDSDLGDPTSLPEIPLAKTDSTTDSGYSFISQVPEIFIASSDSHQVSVPHQVGTQLPSMAAYHSLHAVAQVLDGNDIATLPDGRVVVLTQAPGNEAPMHPYVPTYAASIASQQSLANLQTILHSHYVGYGQTGHEYDYQDLNPPGAYQYAQMGQVRQSQDPFVESNASSVQGNYGLAPIGTGRGSTPQVERHASTGSAPDDSGGVQGYSNLRQNAQRVPHPHDSLWDRGNYGRQDFQSWRNNRGVRMQRFAASNYVGRRTSADDKGVAQPQVVSSTSMNGDNNQQEVSVHDAVARTYQQQMPALPVSVFDANTRHAFEASLIQDTLALQLEDSGKANGHAMDDITPHRFSADHRVSATAPPKLVYQAPMLRSRKGQSTVGLNGSPIQRPSQTLTIDPVHGPPDAFYPHFMPAVVSTSTVSSSAAASVSDVQHQSETSQSRATSVGSRYEEPHTAQGMTFSMDQLVTPTQQHFVRNQVTLVAPQQSQLTLFQMAPNQIAPWPMAPFQTSGSVSRHLSLIAPGGRKPSIDVACDPQNLPFVEILSRGQPGNGNGVVRISNIPYSTTRSEIVAFLGRNADLIDDKLEPIHIIMDRVSGKTMDAYVEFKNVQQAVRAVDRQSEVHRDGNKGGRLGNRFVMVEVSSLESMMRALFPKATNVIWHGAVPEIMPVDRNDKYNTGFKGFINPEELVLLVKHVQDPNRIHFSEKCPQRPFECMISTIVKYPWYMADYITIGDRDEMFNSSIAVVKGLLQRMSEDDIHLHSRLLKRMTRCIFNCPGFTDSQKDDLAFICNINPYTMNPPLAPYADQWNVLKTIGSKPGAQEDVIKYYVALIREATTSMDMVTLAQRRDMSERGMASFFGNINIQYPPNVKAWTFSQVARIEWGVIDTLLRQSLARE